MSERMKLLIGYDGSACADAIISDLERAGLPADCDALVVSISEVWLPSNAPEQNASHPEPAQVHRMRTHAEGLVAAALAVAEGGASRIATAFPGWSISAEASAESPAWGLLGRADEWRPDLLIVGSHGRSALGRFLLGSVSQKIVTEARCSVRVARDHTFISGSPARIVIGVDGSIDSASAVRAVARRNWIPGTAVRIVAALDPLYAQMMPAHDGAGSAGGERGSEWEWMTGMLKRSVDDLTAAGLIASSLVRGIDPKEVLVEEAEAWGADAIFVGARGHGPLERFLLGSVSAAVAARAHCPVEIVRP